MLMYVLQLKLRKKMKIVLSCFLLFISLSLSAYASSAPPNLITVHKTYVEGLNNHEYQYLRVDILGTRDGELAEIGYQTLCIRNHKKALDLKIFLVSPEPEHYQYNVTFSICHQMDAGDIENNKCEKVSTINVDVLKNENNEVQVDLPRYTLDLSPYAGQYSPCNEAELTEKSFIMKKRNSKELEGAKHSAHQSSIKVGDFDIDRELND